MSIKSGNVYVKLDISRNEIMFSFSTAMFLKIIKQVKTVEIHTINTAHHKHCAAMLSQRVATLLIFILSIGSPKPAEHLLIETDD